MGRELEGSLRSREIIFQANPRAKFLFPADDSTEVGGETEEGSKDRGRGWPSWHFTSCFLCWVTEAVMVRPSWGLVRTNGVSHASLVVVSISFFKEIKDMALSRALQHCSTKSSSSPWFQGSHIGKQNGHRRPCWLLLWCSLWWQDWSLLCLYALAITCLPTVARPLTWSWLSLPPLLQRMQQEFKESG